MYFVCRWREDSPLSKRVVRLPDASLLDWFRRGWGQDDPDGWIDSELGGDVYGLSSVFAMARELDLPRPESVDELRALLGEHLWVEGDDEGTFIRLGEHALRVRTDDDEVDLAYYFFDDQAVTASPDRLAFLLYDTWPLPTGVGAPGAAFDHGVAVHTVRLAPSGPESVFSVRVCWDSPDAGTNLDLTGGIVFAGVGLENLAAHLGGHEDSGVLGWPHDARLLRALVGPADESIGPALERYARLPGYNPSPAGIEREAAHDAIHRRVLAQLALLRPAQSLVHIEAHVAQVARYIDSFFGYDQWFLFDARWAAAHPDLARSLLRYAAHWDPYGA
jgi:hypothetical protein